MTHKAIAPFCCCIWVLLSCSLWAGNPTPARAMDTAKSTMTVLVYKTGLFSPFGHNHEIQAPIDEGSLTEEPASVELRVDARQLRVLDKDASDSDRQKVQETMLGPEVLDSQRLAEIRFRSTAVDRLAEGRWMVHGDLTLHGQTRPIKVEVRGQNGHYRGSAELKQKDFGITPVSVAGGTVKVKNEVRVEFDIVAK